jgi:DNA-binding SARP family transcriptional activator
MSHPLDIRILGPLEVERGGGLVPVGGPKAQMLLSVLALRAGTVVAIEDLVSAMWGDDAPADPRPTIQVYLSKFRGAALAGEAASIERAEPGYVFRIDPDQVDAHRFVRTVEEGSAAFGRGDLDAAIDLLDRALTLWRGEPLAGPLPTEGSCPRRRSNTCRTGSSDGFGGRL